MQLTPKSTFQMSLLRFPITMGNTSPTNPIFASKITSLHWYIPHVISGMPLRIAGTVLGNIDRRIKRHNVCSHKAVFQHDKINSVFEDQAPGEKQGGGQQEKERGQERPPARKRTQCRKDFTHTCLKQRGLGHREVNQGPRGGRGLEVSRTPRTQAWELRPEIVVAVTTRRWCGLPHGT